MALFDTMLKSGESLFANEYALDFSFHPKLLLHREKEQFTIANAIRPLFAERNGKNIMLYGRPGIGKTLAVLHVFRELEDEHEEILPVYVNCWQNNSTYKIAIALCEAVNYKFYQNKKTHEIFKDLQEKFNKFPVALCFDEVDKIEDFDFLYTLLESIYRKTVILVSNYKEWFAALDERIRSRLHPELIEFKEYNAQEIQDILVQRKDFAFKPGTVSEEAFAAIVQNTLTQKDIRAGLHLMRQTAEAAEEASSRVITLEHVNNILQKGPEEYAKEPMELDEECRSILDIVKANDGIKIGDMFKKYEEKGGRQSYKTFARKIQILAFGSFVSLKRTTGVGGNSTLVFHQEMKKLSEF
ncbi:AAA family ATPase [Candidatus Woesearchaeota archaeon]|nr:AAA family ATPase [Candidatus Woesearchaeota archaeon]